MKSLGFTLGADPECSIVCNNDLINASSLVISFKNSGYRSATMGVEVPGGIFGYDGCCSTAEFRPNPGSTPKELTDNIGSILSAVSQETHGYAKAITHSGIEPNGGHIHISLPKSSVIRTDGWGDRIVPSNTKEVVAWTLFLSSPLLRLTSSRTRRTRNMDGYGNLSDVRYGSRKNEVWTVELRFLPAEWMSTPKLTEAVLSYIACVHYEALHHKRKLKRIYNKYFREKNILYADLSKLNGWEERNTRVFRAIYRDIKKHIKTFDCYPQYKDSIEYLFNVKRVKQDLRAVQYDALVGWGFSKKTKPTVQAFLNTKPTDEDSVFNFLVRESVAVTGDVRTCHVADDLRSLVTKSKLVPSIPVYLCWENTPKPMSCLWKKQFAATDAPTSLEKKVLWHLSRDTCVIVCSEKTSFPELAEYYYKLQTKQIKHRIIR